METIINRQEEIGKLKIYLKSGETVKRKKRIHTFFPKTTYATYEHGGNVLHHT